MPSRQDQLHSYQYSMQRVVAALVTHDPDPARSPLRKAGTTALVSVLVAALAVTGAAVYGLLTGQSTATATETGVVFQEKGSGARYVFLSADNKLHPVLNYASGLLAANGDEPSMESISADKLADQPLGSTLGIPGAPDSLPGKDVLLHTRWSVCTDNQNAGKPRSILLVGDKLTDGQILASENDARGFLAHDDSDRTMLIFGNHKFTIPNARDALIELAWQSAPVFEVSSVWADAIPDGHDLSAPIIPGVGEDSVNAGLKVGTVVQNHGDNTYAIVLKNGIAPVTPLQSRLMRMQKGVGQPQQVGNYSQLIESPTKLIDSGSQESLPIEVPALITGTPNRVCYTSPPTEKVNGQTVVDGLRVDPTIPQDLTPITAKPPTKDKKYADVVHITRGKGVVVVGVPNQAPDAGTDNGTYSIITDAGYSYPMASHALLPKLGYAGVEPQPVPTRFTDLLPIGAALDPAAVLESGGISPSPGN